MWQIVIAACHVKILESIILVMSYLTSVRFYCLEVYNFISFIIEVSSFQNVHLVGTQPIFKHLFNFIDVDYKNEIIRECSSM